VAAVLNSRGDLLTGFGLVVAFHSTELRFEFGPAAATTRKRTAAREERGADSSDAPAHG
jgi:hypothetical protein